MRSFVTTVRPALTAGLIGIFALSPARADPDADKTAIAARLKAWADAFNARDAIEACDIFAPDLLSTMRGRADEGRDGVCRRIADDSLRPGHPGDPRQRRPRIRAARLVGDGPARPFARRLERIRPRRLPPRSRRPLVDHPLPRLLQRAGLD